MSEFWQQQNTDQPLFENLLWSKPETKQTSGKLLLIGGQASQFANIAKIYDQASKSGAGTIKVLLPDSLSKFVGLLPEFELAPSNKSGSFASNSLAQMLNLSSWADAVVLSGDFGKNSETEATLDKYISRQSCLLCVSSESFKSIDISLINRGKALIVVDFINLQSLAKNNKFNQAFTSNMGVVAFAKTLSDFSKAYRPFLICLFEGKLWVAVNGKVSSTATNATITSALASTTVWLMQNPNQPFEALTTASYEISQ